MEGAEQVVVNIPEILPAEPPQAVPPVGTPASDPDFLTELHQACFTGQLEEVERLLETNSSLPFQSPNEEHGHTALHLAAHEGHDQVVEALLRACRGQRDGEMMTGQFLRATDRSGWTALHHAADKGHASVVDILAGAPEAAAASFVSSPGGWFLLFQANEKNGLTALHLAAIYGHHGVAEALLTASRRAGFQMTAQFLRATDERVGRTALHHAARNGRASVVELLLGAPEAAPSGASCPDLALVKDGVRQSTAFLLAAMVAGDHVEIVRLLLDRNPAQIHAKVGKPQLTPTDVESLRVMRPELVDTADEASVRPKFSEGDYAVTEKEDDADRLRGRGVSIAGHTALHLAASQDNVQVMAYLLKHPDVDVNAIDDDFGMTPLHCAVRTGALRVIKTLLRLPKDKLDVNAQLLSKGPFPPRVEEELEVEKMIRLRRQYSRVLRLPDRLKSLKVLDEGDTALHLAIKFGSRVQALETAELLCRLRHLTPSIQNKAVYRYNALDLALQWWLWSRARRPRAPDANLQVIAVMKAPQRLVHAIAEHPDVQTVVKRVKQQEQGLQSTLNALLVGGTLMAGITFGGFLRPPFGTAFEYHPRAVKWFWVCNSLSFYFAIHTLLTTLHALLPTGSSNPPLAQSLGGTQRARLRMQVLSSTVAMVVSTLTGVGAFATAGFANLSPGMYGVMLPTFVVGAILITSSGLLILRQGVWSLKFALPRKGRVRSGSKRGFLLLLICAPCLVPLIHMVPRLKLTGSEVTNTDVKVRHLVNRLGTVVPMILIVTIVTIVAATS